jgi:hypothetical protein
MKIKLNGEIHCVTFDKETQIFKILYPIYPRPLYVNYFGGVFFAEWAENGREAFDECVALCMEYLDCIK